MRTRMVLTLVLLLLLVVVVGGAFSEVLGTSHEQRFGYTSNSVVKR